MGAFWGRRRHSAAGSPHESGPEQLLGGIAELIVHGFLTDSTDPSPVGTPDAANVDPREPETGRGDGRDPTGSRPSSRARTCTTRSEERTSLRLEHGEAVGVGIVHAATLARLLGCFSWPTPLPTDGTLVSPPSYGSWGRAPGSQVDRLG